MLQLIDDQTASNYYNEIDTATGDDLQSKTVALEAWANNKKAERRRQEEEHVSKVFTDFDNYSAAEGLDAFDEESRYQYANRKFIANQTGDTPENQMFVYPSKRDEVTDKLFGKTGLSEAETFNLIRESLTAKKETETALRELPGALAKGMFSKVAEGKTLDETDSWFLFQDWKNRHADKLGKLPEGWESAMLDRAVKLQARSETMMRELAPESKRAFDTLLAFTRPEDAAALPEAGRADVENISKEFAKLTPEDRQNIYSTLYYAAEADGAGLGKGFFEKIGEGIARGGVNIYNDAEMTAQDRQARQNISYFQSLLDKPEQQPDRMQTAESIQMQRDMAQRGVEENTQRLSELKALREIRQIADGTIDPIKTEMDGILGSITQGAYDFSQSAAYMGAAAVPYVGLPAIMGALTNSNYLRMLDTYPDMDADAALAISGAIAAPQAFIDRFQGRALIGKSPVLNALMKKMTDVRIPIAGRLAIGYGANVAFQTGQEFVQEAMPVAADQIAAAIREDMPEFDAEKAWGAYKDQMPEIFYSMLWAGLIGTGSSTFNELKRNGQFERSLGELEMVGITGEAAQDIAAEQDSDAATAKFQEAWSKRSPEDIQAGIAKRAAQLEAARSNQQNPDLPIRRIEQNPDGTLTHIIERPDGTVLYRTNDSEAADIALIEQTRRVVSNDLLSDTSIISEVLDQWTSEDPTNVAIKSDKFTAQQKLEKLQAAGNVAQIEELHRRIATSPYKDTPYDQINILGEATVEDLGEMVFRGVVTLNENSRPEDAREEIHHVAVRKALMKGSVTLDTLKGWLDATETALPDKFPGLVRDNENDIVESLARVQRAYEDGTINAEEETRLPASFVDYIKRMLKAFKEVLQRAVALRGAFKDGALPAEYESFLADSVGLNQQARVDTASNRVSKDIITDGGQMLMDFSIGSRTNAVSTDTPSIRASNATITGPANYSIGAFHGTPHKVDKFSTAKIGTGEGAQAYGWGLYFAQAKAVGEGYRDQLGGIRLMTADGQMADNIVSTPGAKKILKEARVFWKQTKSLDGFVKQLESSKSQSKVWAAQGDNVESNSQYVKDVDEVLSVIKDTTPTPTGNLYTVDLDVEPEDLLDWDKPFSEQSPKVQAALKAVQSDNPLWKDTISGKNGKPVGGAIYKTLTATWPDAEFSRDGIDPKKKASEALLAAGIPGIRYLDGGSRSDGQGTYNYVAFDENLIKITEENGNRIAASQALTSGQLNYSIGSMPEDQRAAEQSGQPSRGGSLAEVLSKLENAQSKLAGANKYKSKVQKDTLTSQEIEETQIPEDAVTIRWDGALLSKGGNEIRSAQKNWPDPLEFFEDSKNSFTNESGKKFNLDNLFDTWNFLQNTPSEFDKIGSPNIAFLEDATGISLSSFKSTEKDKDGSLFSSGKRVSINDSEQAFLDAVSAFAGQKQKENADFIKWVTGENSMTPGGVMFYSKDGVLYLHEWTPTQEQAEVRGGQYDRKEYKLGFVKDYTTDTPVLEILKETYNRFQNAKNSSANEVDISGLKDEITSLSNQISSFEKQSIANASLKDGFTLEEGTVYFNAKFPTGHSSKPTPDRKDATTGWILRNPKGGIVEVVNADSIEQAKLVIGSDSFGRKHYFDLPNSPAPAPGATNYSIASQSEIDRVNRALGGMNRGPDERLKVYERAKEKFLRVMQQNKEELDAIRSAVSTNTAPAVEQVESERAAKLADLTAEESTEVAKALQDNADTFMPRIEATATPAERKRVERDAKDRAKILEKGIRDKYAERKAAIDTEAKTQRDQILQAATAKDSAANARMRDKVRQTKLVDAIGELDGILKALPPEVRGRVGGFAVLANIGTGDKALADFFVKRIDMIDRQLERTLKEEYGNVFDALLERTKPKKAAAGEKPKGIGADIQSLFAVVREARDWSAEKVDGHIANIETQIASGNLTAEEEAMLIREADLVSLAGDWKNADSSRRAAALSAATETWAKGMSAFVQKKIREREDRDMARAEAISATGKKGDYVGRRKRSAADNGLRGKVHGWFMDTLAWDGVVNMLFGHESPMAIRLSDGQRKAEYAKIDAVAAKEEAIHDLFTKLADGNRAAGEKLMWQMSQPSISANGLNLSELEALSATMLWMQEDGRRHMEGELNENGMPVGKWHYDQKFIDDIESALSPEAKAVRDYLLDAYGKEWFSINSVYREMNGINLPRIQNYSPVTVVPINAPAGMVTDPVTGHSVSATSISPGALRTRGTAIAEPAFRNVVQTYLAHTRQMEHWKAFAPWIKEANGILRFRDVQNSIKEAGGEEATGVLNRYLDAFSQGGNRDASLGLEISQVLNRMASRAAQVALIGRVGTLAIQTTQIGAASAELPMGAYVYRLGKLLTGNLGWGDSLNSAYIQRRLKQMPPIVQIAMEGLKAGKPNQLKHQVEKIGRLISGSDALWTAGTYAMVYDYNLSQAKTLGYTGKAAEDYAHNTAERITDRLAQPTRMGAKSIYEVTATNPGSRLGWAFASEARKNLALLAYTKANRPLKRFGATALGFIVFNLAMGAFIRNAWKDIRDDGDDEDEFFDAKTWNWKRIGVAMATEPLQGIPYLGDYIEKGINAALGQYHQSSDLISFERGVRAIRNIPDIVQGEREMADVLKDIDGMVSLMGLFNQNAAAAASLTHIASDFFGVVENATED
jgi:hypothetical protein